MSVEIDGLFPLGFSIFLENFFLLGFSSLWGSSFLEGSSFHFHGNSEDAKEQIRRGVVAIWEEIFLEIPFSWPYTIRAKVDLRASSVVVA